MTMEALSAAAWVGALLVCGGVAYAGFRIFEWSRIYQPRRAVLQTPDAYGLPYEDIQFVAEDGVLLHGWWLPQAEAEGTILYLHGSGGNLGEKLETIRGLYQRLGLHVFAFDYRGYGHSRGIPTEPGTYRDARAAFEVVRSQYGDCEEPPVVVFGRSLGGAIAVRLAMDKPIKGLIVEATFTSIVDMATELHPGLPARRFGAVHYPSIDRVGRLGMPKLIAHSRDDELVPFRLGQALYEAAAPPKQFFEYRGLHAEHPWARTPAYWDVMKTFVDRALAGG